MDYIIENAASGKEIKELLSPGKILLILSITVGCNDRKTVFWNNPRIRIFCGFLIIRDSSFADIYGLNKISSIEILRQRNLK